MRSSCGYGNAACASGSTLRAYPVPLGHRQANSYRCSASGGIDVNRDIDEESSRCAYCGQQQTIEVVAKLETQLSATLMSIGPAPIARHSADLRHQPPYGALLGSEVAVVAEWHARALPPPRVHDARQILAAHKHVLGQPHSGRMRA